MPKILVADDESGLRDVVKLILSDYDTFEAKDGYEAVKLCEETKPDLILMDIMMPEMDGIDATRAIMDKYPDTKIVAVTAHKTKKGRQMLDAGAINILEKPFKKRELEEVVGQLVS